MASELRLGISACLLGEEVRYDGGHRLDPYLRDDLGRHVTYVPVCPELECGLGVPRESMRLVGDPARPRLIAIRTGRDLTDRMGAWAEARIAGLAAEDLCGFIFKSRSPSCGWRRVEVRGKGGGRPVKRGIGLFARAFLERFPTRPVEDEERLRDPRVREGFIERVFALRRWRRAVSGGRGRANLAAFHRRHELLILAHSPRHCREMGRLVAEAKGHAAETRCARYGRYLVEAMGIHATPSKHAGALTRALGRFRKMLAPEERGELLEAIERFRRDLVPLTEPITLLDRYARKYHQPYLREQWYLHPDPMELRLRNRA